MRLSALRSQLRWLRPGIGIKRWLVVLLLGAMLLGLGLLLLGTTLLGLGRVYLQVDLYRTIDAPSVAGTLTLQFIPDLGRAALLGLVGVALVVIAVARLSRTLLAPFLRPGQDLAGAVSEHQRRGRGPKIVTIGGGTGLATLLRGLKRHTSNITAIVTVADDGGSSGRLRRSLGVLPPGDFRNCIAALADDESLTTQLFQYRFGADKDLGGHSFGNLFITAMSEVSGSFERALLESSQVLAIRGRVIPSTLSDVTLIGELATDAGAETQVSRVEGESQITLALGAIRRVYLQPDDVPAYPGAIRALLEADLIVLGPGSLYTSLIPNLLVRDLVAAIAASRAQKVYVCNTATQPGETEGYSVLDHVAAIERHTRPGLFPVVVANLNHRGTLLPNLHWVPVDKPANGALQLISADLIDAEHPWRHDSEKLANVLMDLMLGAQVGTPGPDDSYLYDDEL